LARKKFKRNKTFPSSKRTSNPHVNQCYRQQGNIPQISTPEIPQTEIRLHYLTMLKNMMVLPLLQRGADGIDEVISLMDAYDLSKEDFESIVEIAELTNADMYTKVATAVKTSFTRS
jgi:pyruvate/oxaloacetate carboxyltransferase